MMRERGIKLAEKLAKALQQKGDSSTSIAMKKYMRNMFDFYGVVAPERKAVCKQVFSKEDLSDVDDEFLHTLADSCYANKHREMHYSFGDFIQSHYIKKLNPNNLQKLEEVNILGKWWDVTDTIAGYFGTILLKDKELHKKKNQEYITHPDMWMRRIALIHQLKFKQKTDEEMLYDNILKTCHEKDFFIRKAIGWALRQHTRTNPKSVIEFIKTNKSKLHRLSKVEGLKYIKNHPEAFKQYEVPNTQEIE